MKKKDDNAIAANAGIPFYFSIPEVAKLISKPKSYFYDAIFHRRLPFPYIRIGKSIRISADDLRAYLASARIENN